MKMFVNELTSKELETISPVFSTTMYYGDNLTYALTNLQSAIDRAREEMSQSER